jgi:hypothetical protein
MLLGVELLFYMSLLSIEHDVAVVINVSAAHMSCTQASTETLFLSLLNQLESTYTLLIRVYEGLHLRAAIERPRRFLSALGGHLE